VLRTPCRAYEPQVSQTIAPAFVTWLRLKVRLDEPLKKPTIRNACTWFLGMSLGGIRVEAGRRIAGRG
jgi:hypothetical protein